MRGRSYIAAATSFQNFTTTPPTCGPGRGNRVSYFHGIEFRNPPPEIQIGDLRSQSLVAGCTDDGFLPKIVSIRRNPLLPLASSESQVELEIVNEDEIQTELPDKDNSPTVHIRLELRRECQFGEKFLVAGDHPVLGLWNPLDAAPMVWSDGHVWTTELDLPAGKLIQFKFIFRDISGKILWQPGPNRVLQTREMSKITVVLGDWKTAAIRQVTEVRKGDNQYEVYDELMIHEDKQLTNDGVESNKQKEKPHLENYNSSIASLNGEAMAMVAENIEYDTLQESGYIRKELQVEGHVNISSTEAGALKFNSLAGKEEVAILNKALIGSKDMLETIQEIPVLVPGLTPCLITPAEDATAMEEELELDVFDNARKTIAENSEPECLRQSQIQLDLNEENIQGYRENAEEEEEIQEVIAELMFDKEHASIEYPNKPGFINGHEPDQGLQLTYFEGQGNRNKSILYNAIKWGQETLRRFLDKLGFRLQF